MSCHAAALGLVAREASGGRLALAAAAGVAGATALALAPPPKKAPSSCYFEVRDDGSVDRLRKWSAGSWAIGYGKNPGFHLPDVNPLLAKHLPALLKGASAPAGEDADKKGPAVLVPLCGKTNDMPYLCRQGLSVVGVEGVSRPLLEFRMEQRRNGLQGFDTPRVVSLGPTGWSDGAEFQEATKFEGARVGKVFKRDVKGLGYYSDSPRIWRGEVASLQEGTEVNFQPIHVIEGDFFEVTPELVAGVTFVQGGTFDVAYDRGSMVAIPPSAREQYAGTLSALLNPGGRILMVVVDYDQSRVQGPPFSVPMSEVRRLFPGSGWTVEVLEEVPSDLTTGNPKFRGVAATERVLLVTKRRTEHSGGRRALKYGGLMAACLGGLGLALSRQ